MISSSVSKQSTGEEPVCGQESYDVCDNGQVEKGVRVACGEGLCQEKGLSTQFQLGEPKWEHNSHQTQEGSCMWGKMVIDSPSN